MTIYAVTSGSYSDYGIEQLFLSREKALAFIKTREAENKWEDFRIEVYDTYDDRIEMADRYLEDVYLTCTVCCDVENGGNWYVESFCQYISHERNRPEISCARSWRDGKRLNIKVKLTVQPQFEDSLIIKIAQDEYAKWKAEKEEEK